MELDRRLSKAKTALILDHPFFGNLAMNMPQIITDAVPTAATNGKHILYNPDFCKGLNNDNLVFLIAHEVMHPALDHITRVGERDPERWNYAGDTVINPMLVDEGIGAFIDGGVMDRDLLKQGGGTTDGVYNLLPPQPNGGGGYGNEGQGKPFDELQPYEGSPAEVEQLKSEWKVKVAQAAQAAKMMGKLSAGLERFVGDLLQPRVNWRDVMNRFIVKQRNEDRTWSRPRRPC